MLIRWAMRVLWMLIPLAVLLIVLDVWPCLTLVDVALVGQRLDEPPFLLEGVSEDVLYSGYAAALVRVGVLYEALR